MSDGVLVCSWVRLWGNNSYCSTPSLRWGPRFTPCNWRQLSSLKYKTQHFFPLTESLWPRRAGISNILWSSELTWDLEWPGLWPECSVLACLAATSTPRWHWAWPQWAGSPGGRSPTTCWLSTPGPCWGRAWCWPCTGRAWCGTSTSRASTGRSPAPPPSSPPSPPPPTSPGWRGPGTSWSPPPSSSSSSAASHSPPPPTPPWLSRPAWPSPSSASAPASASTVGPR